MDNQKNLYVKKSLPLLSYLCMSKNPFMLLRWSKHFILKIVTNECFFEMKPCRITDLLFPDFYLKVCQLKEFYEKLYTEQKIGFFETFRSESRQHYLFGNNVTRINSLGMHHFGLACDFVKVLNNNFYWLLDYDALRKAGNEIGLTNLYPFESCHFQFIPCHMQTNWRIFYVNLVRIVQDLLNCKIDGKLGKITQGAILLNVERLESYFLSVEKELKGLSQDEK